MGTAEKLSATEGVQKVPSPRLDLFIKRDFLAEEECANIREMIDRKRRPSEIADDIGDPVFRTSETCDLDHSLPEVQELDRKICDFVGIDPQYGEPIQGQHYEVGQEFKAHTDFFTPGGEGYEIHCKLSGQRTWTVMIYLNEPEAGGATRFKKINKTVRPERGKLLAWNNRTPDGGCNADTLHHAMKVRAGRKYVITKWFRELPWRTE
ncbi:MAG: prolyl hydroxylase family protein [Sphingomonadaceae bacterium]